MTDKLLLVATHNQGKAAELATLLADVPVTIADLKTLGIESSVDESGTTFEENAIQKATHFALLTGLVTVADDSGLEVTALNGLPGVKTARFGGVGLTPEERYLLLLRRLEGIPWRGRQARFRSAIALARGGELLGVVNGVCEGYIALKPAGDRGFGYDPVFFIPEFERTMAQLMPEEKRAISHRGQALRAIKPLILKTLGFSKE